MSRLSRRRLLRGSRRRRRRDCRGDTRLPINLEQSPSDHQFELQSRRGHPRHPVEANAHRVGDARQLSPSESLRLLEHATELILRHPTEHGGSPVDRRGTDHDEVAQSLKQVLGKAARILPGLNDTVRRPERRRRVWCGERRHDVIDELGVREAEQPRGPIGRHSVALRARDELVKNRQRVAHRATAGPNHERQHSGFDSHALTVAQRLRVVDEGPRGDEPERVVVRARADRADHLVGLGCREHELHVRRRFFDDLEQRVEPAGGDHVCLVDDEDLEAIPRRRKDCTLTKVTRIIDAAVTRRVDLDDVERSAALSAQLDTARARTARSVGRPLSTVQAAGENSRRRRLAATAGAAEQVGVPDATGPQCRPQWVGHLGLADHLGEALGPVTAIQCGNHGTMLPAGTDIALSGPKPQRDPSAHSPQHTTHSTQPTARRLSPQPPAARPAARSPPPRRSARPAPRRPNHPR